MDAVEADQIASQEDDQTDQLRAKYGNAEDVETVQGCARDQCPWCGFRDHNRKSKYKCPQHPSYDSSYNNGRYEKGAKVSDDGIPGNRESHKKHRRKKSTVTPLSVLSPPSDPAFKAESWTEGKSALENFTPKQCHVQKQTTTAINVSTVCIPMASRAIPYHI